jgi:hypothetical protein
MRVVDRLQDIPAQVMGPLGEALLQDRATVTLPGAARLAPARRVNRRAGPAPRPGG